MSPWFSASKPADRDKEGWYKSHNENSKAAFVSPSELLLIGDSIVFGLKRYKAVNKTFFPTALNHGIRGDRVENVLWRLRNTRLNSNVKTVLIHCGTNNLDHNTPTDIVNGLMNTAPLIHLHHPHIKIIISGILPRDDIHSPRRHRIAIINGMLKERCAETSNVYFLEHDHDWTWDDGRINANFYYVDDLHLVAKGNYKFAKKICSFICNLNNRPQHHILSNCLSSRGGHASQKRKPVSLRHPSFEIPAYLHSTTVSTAPLSSSPQFRSRCSLTRPESTKKSSSPKGEEDRNVDAVRVE